jgi:hypothetical protein
MMMTFGFAGFAAAAAAPANAPAVAEDNNDLLVTNQSFP